MKFKRIKNLQLVAFVSVFALTLAIMCPYICAATPTEQTSDHACHKEVNDTQNDQEESGECCDQHEPATLVKNSTDVGVDYLQYQVLAFVVELLNPIIKNNTSSFLTQERPPGYLQGNPLYIVKNSFLI